MKYVPNKFLLSSSTQFPIIQQHLCPSEDEVATLFTLSLQQLLDPSLAGHEDLGLRSSKAPYYLGGPAKASKAGTARQGETAHYLTLTTTGYIQSSGQVWGLTAFILQGVLLNVLRPALPPNGATGEQSRVCSW